MPSKLPLNQYILRYEILEVDLRTSPGQVQGPDPGPESGPDPGPESGPDP